MKKILIIFFVFLFFQAHSQQAPRWEWALSVGDAGAGVTNGIVTDASGNIYVTGFFEGDLNIPPFSISNTGGQDIFIAKYNAAGIIQWVKSAGGQGNDQGAGVALDDNGDIYALGQFTLTAQFGTEHLTSAGQEDIFLAKYNTSGDLQWVKGAGGIHPDKTYGSGCIDVLSDHTIVTTGFYADDNSEPAVYGTADFGGITLTSAGGGDVFLAKYDNAGNVLWAKSGGGKSADRGTSVTTDADGNIYTSGHFDKSSSVFFGSIQLNGIGFSDIFVAKYDNAGNVIWAKSAGGDQPDYGTGIAVDTAGNVYVTGGFNSAQFKAGNKTVANRGFFDIFIVKYDNHGAVQWLKSAGWTGADIANGMTIDADANLYITGTFESACIFNNDTLKGFGGPDVFVAKIDKNGSVRWKQKAGGTGFDEGNGIAIDKNGSVCVTGRFSSAPASFGTNNISSQADFDMFVAKMGMFPEDVQDVSTADRIAISPNPATDILLVHNAMGSLYSVTDITGRSLLSGNITTTNFTVPLNSLPTGMYVIEIAGKDDSSRIKFVKQ